MLGLEIWPKVGLEWWISEACASWVMAGRKITEDEPRISEGDAMTFTVRAASTMFFGMIQIMTSFLGVVWCVLLGYYAIIFVPIGQALLVALVLTCTHVANRRRAVTQKTSIDVAAFCLVVLCTFGSPLLWRLFFSFRGWHWSTGASIWKWGATVGAVLLFDRPVTYGSMAYTAGMASDVVVMVACREMVSDPAEDETGFVFTMISVVMSYALFPAFMADQFRRQCKSHLLRLEAEAAQAQRLEAYRASSRFLIFSLIPHVKATKLHHATPSLWHREEHEEYPDCTLVQMDVSGFTALSSKVGSEELVDFINAIFTSVEYAAECIGKAWMVELVGDCAKFIVGGPYECDDHPYRACVLGASILEVCERVARRLKISVTVRVGIHTGGVWAAVTGAAMPRYLLYGRDTHVVDKCEAGASINCVLASNATAEAVGDRWPLQQAQQVTLSDGSLVQGWEVDAARQQEAMAEARRNFPVLDDLLLQFATAPRESLVAAAGSGDGAPSSQSGRGAGRGLFQLRAEVEGGGYDAAAAAAAAAEEEEGGVSRSASDARAAAISSPLGRRMTQMLAEEISEISLHNSLQNHSQRRGSALFSLGGSTHNLSLVGSARSLGSTPNPHSQHNPKPRLSSVTKSLPSSVMVRIKSVESILERGPTAQSSTPETAGLPGSLLHQASGGCPGSSKLSRCSLLSSSEGGRSMGSGLGMHVAGGPEAAKLADAWMREDFRDGMPEDEAVLAVQGDQEKWMESILENQQQKPFELWLPEHGASSLHLQRTCAAVFLWGAAGAAAAQTFFLLALHLAGHEVGVSWEGEAKPTAQLLVILQPALILVLLLAALAAARFRQLDWATAWPHAGATTLLALSAIALEGSSAGRAPTRTAILWAAAAGFIPITRIRIGSRQWMWALVGYWGICFALTSWEEMSHEGGTEELSSAVEWWRDILMVVNFWVAGSVLLAPMMLATRCIISDQRRARALLARTRKQVLVEGKLLEALVPTEVKERFLRGDRLVADRIQDGTVLFVYVAEYSQIMLKHGPSATIAWINKVFAALDDCILHAAVCKVETFNNFLLLYARNGSTHVAETLFLGLDMLAAIEGLDRPDGKPTALLLGISTGDFTAGIIGAHTPRYSIFGDTVNTASRMASNSRLATHDAPFIHLSPSSYNQVSPGLEAVLQERSSELAIRERSGGMTIKGKGWMQTHSLSHESSAPASALASRGPSAESASPGGVATATRARMSVELAVPEEREEAVLSGGDVGVEIREGSSWTGVGEPRTHSATSRSASGSS